MFGENKLLTFKKLTESRASKQKLRKEEKKPEFEEEVEEPEEAKEAVKPIKEPEPSTLIEEEKPRKKEKFKHKEKPVIESVKIVEITDLWRKKPKFLSLESHAIIVAIKTPEEKMVKETFYAYIKPNETFNIKSGRTKTLIQQRFVNFLKYYKLADKLEDYKIFENTEKWKGKAVKLDENDKIVIPK